MINKVRCCAKFILMFGIFAYYAAIILGSGLIIVGAAFMYWAGND